MKQRILIFVAVLFLIQCGSNKQEELNNLLTQRDALNAQIEKLEREIAHENGTNTAGKTVNVQVEQISPGLFRHFIKIQGTAESDKNILIPAQSGGVVKKIHVHEGQWVHKDQLLAELDGAILENMISELEVNLTLARTVYERQSRLWEKNIGSEVQYLQAKTTMESLEKRMGTVKEQYQLTKIVAPIDGTVDQILLKEGEAVGAGFGTIRVVNPTDLKITANLSEEYMGKVQAGDSVQIHFPVRNVSFISTLRAVSQVVNSQNRTFPIEVTLPVGARNVSPNMLAVLTINDYENTNALKVPVNVVQKTGENYFLFVASVNDARNSESWQVTKRIIEPGLNYANQVEVLTGLKPNEYVVTQGFGDLADQQDVIVTNEGDFLSAEKK